MVRFYTNNSWNEMLFRYRILDLLEERKWTERNLFPHSESPLAKLLLFSHVI